MKRLHDGASGSNPAYDIKRLASAPADVQINLRRHVGEIFGYWLVDRCRVFANGDADDYIERYIPWYILGQLSRTMRRDRPCRFALYIKSVEPNYGCLVHQVDWAVWKWFVECSKREPFKWFPPNQEPVEIHTNEYLEVSGVNLRGNFNAFKKFPDLNV